MPFDFRIFRVGIIGTCRSIPQAMWTGLRLLTVLTLLCIHATAAEPLPPAQLEFFEARIRPVLVEQCYKCHNSTKSAEGGLAVDHRAALLKGGDSGPIVVPGKPADSSLLPILRHAGNVVKMPKDGGKLDEAVIADFGKWIEMGVPDPRDTPPTEQELAAATSWENLFNNRKKWWSFQPVVKPVVPIVNQADEAANPVDRFLIAKQQERGLSPAAAADQRALLRRLTFVLTGLPPTPEEATAFLADESDGAYEAAVDRLLDSPRFGERWARHWMDLMRYCESHGSQGDPELPNAYRYRDYLIRAFNDDVPYDQLVREHLAGDLLPNPRWNAKENFNESSIGPAHLRMVELGFVPVDALDDQVKVVDNQIDVVSKAFLGLTVSCARCHNHKFDPISQEDFYALYGVFASCHSSQVLIDSPALLQKNRDELLALKRTIREGLAAKWLEVAGQFGERLREQTRRDAQLIDLNGLAAKVREAIATIEDPARAKVLRERGLKIAGGLPVPDSRWSFEGDARDGVGSHHGELLGGAVLRDGRLILNGTTANMRTSSLERDYHEKTLEAWVSLANLDQRGGGVIGLDTPEGRFFDSIVFGEMNPKHWMPGSDFFNRTQDPGGPAESAPLGEFVHVAIVYSKDNAITFYRNGERYGQTYKKGTLQPFLKGKSRFLFGQRLSDINPPLAGEVEEARAYARALSEEEIAASFRAGAAGVSADELAAALSEEERQTVARLKARLTDLTRQSQALSRADAGADAWRVALADATTNSANPLHPLRLATTEAGRSVTDSDFQEKWLKLVEYWNAERKSRVEFNASRFTPLWDLRTAGHSQWSRSGVGLPQEPTHNGEFSIEPDGDRVLTGLLSAGIFSHTLTRKHPGVFTSPRFTIETDSVFLRALGQNSMARLVIENYPIGNGGIYPATRLNQTEAGWLRLDTNYRKGSRAYFEFVTDATERAHFGVVQTLASNQSELPRETAVAILPVLRGDAPRTVDDLADRYSQRLRDAVRAWREDSLNEEDAALLGFFTARDLLPTTLTALPQLKEAVERYRQLEREIPVPRRAPGVLEIEPFDQPLFTRGVHTRPAERVARRGLSLLDATPFATRHSGRAELAEQIASPTNPLLARVMVNRLWHHTFGRGLVATVDNFGHLGNKPTHPELLDYLAVRFMEERWSVKSLLRLLVTSRAFRQSSQASSDAHRIDPANLLLSHMPVRRLEAEAIRDATLATTGQLDLAMYGPGINVYYVAKTEGGGPKGPLDGDRRRSVYLRIRRNAHNPFLEAFDAPKPATTRGKRDTTNVPAQSLTMLNDPFVIDQSAKWAKKLVADGLEPAERIRKMYLCAFCREPNAAEMRETLAYLNDLIAEHEAGPADAAKQELVWQDLAHAIFCLKEFVYVH